MNIDCTSWYLIDAQNKTLGRLATHIAQILKGKNKITYLPYLDNGNHIIVINAKKIYLTGNKINQKTYYYHSGKPGHLKQKSFAKLQCSSPKDIIQKAVKGMLPKNSLGTRLLKKLKIYETENHPHSAQQPQLMKI